MKKVLIILMIFTYLISVFTGLEIISALLAILAFIILISGFTGGNTFSRVISFILLSASIVIAAVYGMDWKSVLYGINQNVPILSLILMAPMIAVPLRLNGYLKSLFNVLKSLSHNAVKAYSGLIAFLFVISPVFNIGSIRITHDIISEIGFSKRFLAMAYIPAYTSAIVWSPYFASVATILYMFEDLSLSDYILIGLPLGIIQILIGIFIFYTFRNKSDVEQVVSTGIGSQQLKEDWNNIYKIFLSIVGFIGLIIIIEYITKGNIITIIILTAIVVPVIWGFLTGNIKSVLKEIEKISGTFPNFKNETILFLSAGLLASVLSGTSFGGILTPMLVQISDTSYLLFVMTILLLIVLLTLIGLHQIVVVPLIIIQVPPELVGIDPLVLSFIFILGWSISVVTSPVSLTTLLVSNLLKTRWWEIGFKMNGLYLIILTFSGIILSLVLNFLI